MTEFNPREEAFTAYILRMKDYFKANSVKDENRVSVFMTVIGPKVLATFADLVAIPLKSIASRMNS